MGRNGRIVPRVFLKFNSYLFNNTSALRYYLISSSSFCPVAIFNSDEEVDVELLNEVFSCSYLTRGKIENSHERFRFSFVYCLMIFAELKKKFVKRKAISSNVQ